MDKCVVNDVAAIMARLPLSMPARHYTTPQVEIEVIDRESREGLLFMLDSGRLVIREPGRVEVKLPDRLLSRLSPADISLLRLALTLMEECGRVYLATDDYALQEAAVRLGIEALPVRYRGARVARRR